MICLRSSRKTRCFCSLTTAVKNFLTMFRPMNQYYIENEINSECIGLKYISPPNHTGIIQDTQEGEERAFSSSEIIVWMGGVDQQLDLSGPNLQVEYDGPKNDSYCSYDLINHQSKQNRLQTSRNDQKMSFPDVRQRNRCCVWVPLVYNVYNIIAGSQIIPSMSLNNYHEFSFCFALRKLTLVEDSPSGWHQYHSFRVEIYRHEHFVSATPNIPCTPDQNQQLILRQENVTFTLHLPNHSVKEVAQVRLYGKNASGQDKLVGCYEFLLNNYVRAYQELNRNYIQLRVQIAEDYVIVYDVFVEHTEEALMRLVQEHETAHRLHIAEDDISEIDSFLPHEISNHHLEEIYKDIRNKEENSTHKHRYWSPKRQRPSIRLLKDMEEVEKVENTHSTIVSEHTRVHLLNAHKSISADMSFSLQRLEAEEVASQAEKKTQDRYKTIEELYKVIGSDSKIIQPGELEQHQKQRLLHLRSSHFNGSRHKSIKKTSNIRFALKYIVITVLLATLTAFLMSSFSASDQPYHIRRSTNRVKSKH